MARGRFPKETATLKGLRSAAVVLLAVLCVLAAGCFALNAEAANSGSDAQGQVELPAVVRVIAGEGVYGSYSIKAQVSRYGEVIYPFAAEPCVVLNTYSGKTFPSRERLKGAAAEFADTAAVNLRAFGYDESKIYKIYSADVNEDYSVWTFAAAVRVAGADGNVRYLAYVACGSDAAISPYYAADASLAAFEGKYKDTLTYAAPANPFAGMEPETISPNARQAIMDLLYNERIFASCPVDITRIFADYKQPVSRADFILMLMSALEKNYPQSFSVRSGTVVGRTVSSGFKDTSLPYINMAREFGLVSGHGNGIFGPDGFLKYGHASSILTKALNKLSESYNLDADTAAGVVGDFAADANDFVPKLDAIVLIWRFMRAIESPAAASEMPAASLEDAKPVNRSIIKGTFLPPADFVDIDANSSGIKAKFAEPFPDFNKPGRKPVLIDLQDGGGDTKRLKAFLSVYEGSSSIKREIGRDAKALSAGDFLAVDYPNTKLLTNTGYFDFTKLGRGFAAVALNDDVRYCAVRLVDTTPPVAKAKTVLKYVGDSAVAGEFVTDVYDPSGARCEFADAPPDMSVAGEYKVRIMLTDDHGNYAFVDSALVIKQYVSPPVFEYIPNRYFQIGQQADLLSQVKIGDKYDQSAVIQFDASRVNLTKPGRYPITYTATDRDGGKAIVTAYVVMTETSIEKVFSLADRVLASIIKENMTQREKTWAVYDWVTTHMYYIGVADKIDPIQSAYEALTKARGACYAYYSVSEILLTRLGIKNVCVERLPNFATMHYWCLVDIGDGWYHFDPSPYRTSGFDEGFMIDDATALALTTGGKRNLYYNRSLYEGYDIK